MADTKISALADGSTLQTSDEFPVRRAGNNVKINGTQLRSFAQIGAFVKAVDDTDDITQGATNLFLTAAQSTKLSGIEAGAIANIVSDTTPQLGGNLDVNGSDIVSASNTDIDILPHGTGKTNIKAGILQDATDGTKKLAFALSGIATGTTRSLTMPDADVNLGNMVTASNTAAFTNKTFDANGTGNTLSNVETADIASGSKTGADAKLVTGTAGSTNQVALWNVDGDIVGLAQSDIKSTETFILACSDESTALTTGTAKVTFRIPYAFTVTAVRASLNTAPVGSTLIVDINEGGTSVLGTKLSIDASEKTSTTAASAATITDASLADDAEITIDIDQVGSSTAGAGLKVYIIGSRI
jgi:hypothetical protein